MQSKYPPEAQLFRLARESNGHWGKGDYVELVEVEQLPMAADDRLSDWRLIHHCNGYSHMGHAWSIQDLVPLTPVARQMLAIARGTR